LPPDEEPDVDNIELRVPFLFVEMKRDKLDLLWSVLCWPGMVMPGGR
jgi:hypothetical protein